MYFIGLRSRWTHNFIGTQEIEHLFLFRTDHVEFLKWKSDIDGELAGNDVISQNSLLAAERVRSDIDLGCICFFENHNHTKLGNFRLKEHCRVKLDTQLELVTLPENHHARFFCFSAAIYGCELEHIVQVELLDLEWATTRHFGKPVLGGIEVTQGEQVTKVAVLVLL